jgi:hypothetical protein
MCIENELHEIMNLYIDFFSPIKLNFFNVTKLNKFLNTMCGFYFCITFLPTEFAYGSKKCD